MSERDKMYGTSNTQVTEGWTPEEAAMQMGGRVESGVQHHEHDLVQAARALWHMVTVALTPYSASASAEATVEHASADRRGHSGRFMRELPESWDSTRRT